MGARRRGLIPQPQRSSWVRPMGHIDHPIRLPASLTDGEITLDGHAMPDAEAHLQGEDEEMLLRFGAARRANIEQTRAAIRRWIDARAAGGPMFAYALRQPSRLLMGGCEIRRPSPDRAAVSYWVFPEFRRRGYATRALLLLCGHAALIQDVRQLEAHIDADNVGSRRAAEKAGFIETGIVHEVSPAGTISARILYARPVIRRSETANRFPRGAEAERSPGRS
jgi:RimJ/RimL family protein N-acetyltransferase